MLKAGKKEVAVDEAVGKGKKRKGRREAPGRRLFVSCVPPVEVARSMARYGEVLGRGNSRPTAVEQIHVTVVFIGQIHPKEYEQVVESVGRSVSGVARFELRPRALATLPREGDVRTLAVLMDSPGSLLEIRRRLVHRLARTREKARGECYSPHATIARVKNGARAERVDVANEELAKPIGAFEVTRVVLVESFLKAGGAEHVVREAYELG